MTASQDSPATPSPGYWTKQQAAAYLSVRPHTIDYLCRVQQLPYYLIAGKRRFTQTDLDDYAARQRRTRDTSIRGS